MKREDLLKQMIADYRKKTETYQTMIQEWERELGVPSSTQSSDGTKGKTGLTVEVQPWQFLGRSQPEAAKELLKMVGHPLTTEEILEGIKKGGVEVGGDKYTFYSILNRQDDLGRAKKNTWGLSDWAGVTKRKKKPKEEKSEKQAVK
jgi:hypothetical protein